MDDFVHTTLTEWGLSELIEKFKDEEIDLESLLCLDDQEIAKLIPKTGPRSKFKDKLKSLRVLPSTSDTTDNGKRKMAAQCESSKWQSPAKRRRDAGLGSYSERIILCDVKNIMTHVNNRLCQEDNTRLNAFLKAKISDLETDKRELVGVFGKSGAGKSSLINAIIKEKNLLPSGSVNACTTVMIKVEANMHNQKYEADIEFITKEEWKDELWSLLNFHGNNPDQEREEDEDYSEVAEKLSALYGDEWKNKSPESLMDNKYFREIPEFHQENSQRRKILTCGSAKELSARLDKYTRSDSKQGAGKEVKRWYWPLVKCVTVKVPNKELLQHVTLVDLPGNGDRNKSRDEMWKGVVGSCSAVWIVTDINRAAAEKEPWEILKSACSLMGNGGECQRIHFICTKSDLIEDMDELSAVDVREHILKRNMQAKETVKDAFRKIPKIKKHFSEDCLTVFTVSSKEFLKQKRLRPDDTEIPKLQKFLQDLNDCHSETLNYVSGAYGILSLIQGARCREVACQKVVVCKDIEEKLRQELDKVRKPMEEACKVFERCLCEGVENSKSSCGKHLKTVLYPSRVSGRGFHKTLKRVVENNGIFKTKKGKEINLNVKLASCLTDSIDEEFRKTFPNEGNCGPFNGVINTFSLDTEMLIHKYKDVELQLIFLKTEEEKIKTRLHKIIRERKKKIYSSLTETIEAIMIECYQKAATFSGKDTLKNTRDIIERHVYDLKNTMFAQTKDDMLAQMTKLKEHILKTLEETMQKSVDLSLKTDDFSIPDFATELEMLKLYHIELMGSPNEETSLISKALWLPAALPPVDSHSLRDPLSTCTKDGQTEGYPPNQMESQQ
ncbi:nuclear GTPase SLIP-GC-like [Scomber scombrus]|uniref:nuclear GTPase SLIP-GC-like n=1 Tax=Scomber scombrus TaxID=13677 RepID=UPI002DD8404A|nr:nuclear GTPase SLIP-GC-like [Scomber scombrus]